jgi:hypothetical protein
MNLILPINDLNTTPTIILNNLNSYQLNRHHQLIKLIINSTSTTLLSCDINKSGINPNNSSQILKNLSTDSTSSISNITAASTTLFNKINFSNLFVYGASTLLSSCRRYAIIGTWQAGWSCMTRPTASP